MVSYETSATCREPKGPYVKSVAVSPMHSLLAVAPLPVFKPSLLVSALSLFEELGAPVSQQEVLD
jgi:hypothetical protein